MKKIARYSLLSRILHWFIMPLLFIQIVLGFYAASLPLSLDRLIWLSRHKSLGMLLLACSLFRVTSRLLHNTPAYAQSLSSRQVNLIKVVHFSLYACMLLLPVTGWLMASAAKLPPSFFGWFAFPALIAANESLKEVFIQIHTVLVWLFCCLLSMHIIAALYHLLILKDTIIVRISWWRR